MANSTLAVTVMVVDAEDTGEVSFVQREPQVDKTITAKVSDPDGGSHQYDVAVGQGRTRLVTPKAPTRVPVLAMEDGRIFLGGHLPPTPRSRR